MSSGFRTPLADPEHAKVDIVFVHGLGGHRQTSWTSRNDIYWPQELLPKAVPEARILSWGYDARLIHFWSSQSDGKGITDFAKELFSDLAGLREHSVDRPIFLVAHSLGGIVCAEALLIASNLEDHLRRIGENVRGLIFFGTPLRGSKLADWAELAKRVARMLAIQSSELPGDLIKGSRKLVDITGNFSNLLLSRNRTQEQRIKAMFFYEARDTWISKVKVGRIVEKDSATLDGYSSFQISADHREICKWDSADDDDFRRLVDTLRNWLRDFEASHSDEKMGSGHVFHGSTFNGPNYGGHQIGNMHSFGPSPAFEQKHTFNFGPGFPSGTFPGPGGFNNS